MDKFLPEIGDLYDLGYNGLCICTGLNEKAKTIDWYDLRNSRYFVQGYQAFWKFQKLQWANKK